MWEPGDPAVQGILQTGSNPSEVLGVSELLVWRVFPDKGVACQPGHVVHEDFQEDQFPDPQLPFSLP